MNRFVFNKWFILSVLLVSGLLAFSFAAYRETHAVCEVNAKHEDKQASATRGKMSLDALSTQFLSASAGF